MPVWLGAATLCMACAKPGLPGGPTHKPFNSPEAATACPDERAAAHTAREDLLEFGADETRSARAAEAVYAHAECERAAFAKVRLGTDEADALMAKVRELRDQFRDALTLYGEADKYESPVWALRARIGIGASYEAFVDILVNLHTPVDLRQPAQRDSFRQEIDDLVSDFRVEAARAYAAAIDRAAELGDGLVTVELKAACEGLDRVAPGAARGDQRCVQLAGN